MPTYDLATRFIPDDHQIWALHSGRNRRQYPIFQEKNIIYLEIPGFNANNKTFSKNEFIHQHLRMSDAFRNYVSGKLHSPPSNKASSYDNRLGKDKSFIAAVANVRALYAEAKQGDLVLVPGRGQYEGVLMGEIVDEFNPEHVIEVPQFPGFSLPYRNIRWIKTNTTKRELGYRLARSLENRHAIIRIEEKTITKEAHGRAYDNYVFSENSKLTIFGPKYKGNDPEGIIVSAELVKYFVAAYRAIEQGNLNNFINLDINNAIHEYYDSSIVDEFSFNFNSPGKITIISLTSALTLFVSLGVAVATDNIQLSSLQSGIKLENSLEIANTSQATKAGVDFSQLIGVMTPHRYEELKKRGSIAKDGIGLDTPVKRVK